MLKNSEIMISFEDKDITMYKLQDINETTLYTTSKRNLTKAINEIKATFNDITSWQDIVAILNKYDMKYRRFCGLDQVVYYDKSK